MKTEFNRSNNDNIANTAGIAASLFALAGALFSRTSATAAATAVVQKWKPSSSPPCGCRQPDSKPSS